MGFTTTSKGLIKPNNDNSTPADVSQLNTNFDRIDGYGMGPYVCTSTTRPTGADRWDGLLIKETDTKAFGIYDAATASWLMYDTVWQTFTPTLKVNGTAITPAQIGNGVLIGQYFRAGKQVRVRGGFSFGSTTTYGGASGSLSLVLPPGMSWPAAFSSMGFISGSAAPTVGVFGALVGTNTYDGTVYALQSNLTEVFFSIKVTASISGGGNVVDANKTLSSTLFGTSGYYINYDYTITLP